MNTKKIIPLGLASIALASQANAALNVIQNDVSNNTAWTQAGFSAAGSTELYDERSLTINDGQGLTITSIQILLDTTGTFDDSLAIDIDADGTIDLISSQSDAYATAGVGSGNYQPWVTASPFTLSATITSTGTTIPHSGTVLKSM